MYLGCTPTFTDLLREYVPTGLRGPFNLDARRAAGFDDKELACLTMPSCAG